MIGRTGDINELYDLGTGVGEAGHFGKCVIATHRITKEKVRTACVDDPRTMRRDDAMTMRCHAVRCDTMRCHAVSCDTMRCHAVGCHVSWFDCSSSSRRVACFLLLYFARGRVWLQKACKIICKAKFAKSSGGLAQFQQEVEILKSLNHKNIARFEEFFEDKVNLYILMELCTGTAPLSSANPAPPFRFQRFQRLRHATSDG